MATLYQLHTIANSPVSLARISMALAVYARGPLQVKPETMQQAKVYRMCWDFRFRKTINDVAPLVASMIMQHSAMADYASSVHLTDLDPEVEEGMDIALIAAVTEILPIYANTVVTDAQARDAIAGKMN